ncbi:MAG: hypothetical protein K2M99_07615 [Treponemataceae bacterium]|nr:hypothetical protein [Treponemataceae bacterium]
MKKLMLLFGAVAILLAACSNDPENLESQNKIESAKDGDTISLRDDDDKGGTYIVTAKNLTLVGANMPKTTIVVSEEIGDADFTLENCVFKSLEVRGGGSNSVHITGGKIIEKVIAKKENVRIVLEAGANIADLRVEANCTLDADANEKNAVASISISEVVKEFKIGAENATTGTDKSIAITITKIQFDTTAGTDFKIVVTDPKIVEKTVFSSDMSDKVVGSDEKKIPVQTATDNEYIKLPLKIQEKGLRFPADTDGWSDGITVESKEDGEVFLIKNANPISKNVFNIGANINMPYDGKKGKGYIIQFDLKADADCYVDVWLEDRFFIFENPAIYCHLSKNWKTFELHTGKLYEDWSEYTTLTIFMGNASKVEIKNLKIKEDENPSLPTNVYYSTTEYIDSIEVTSGKDYVVFTSTPPLRTATESDPLTGVNILFGVLDTGKLYKVTFDVTPDATGSFMNVWGHAVADAYDTAGNAHLSFESGKKKKITLYIPCYAIPYDVIDKNGKKIGSGKREKSIANIWFSCFDGKEHTIKVENINYSVVEDIEAIKQQDNLFFYVSGNVTDNGINGKANYEWTWYRDPKNPDDDIILMPGYGFYFEYMMSDEDGWGSETTTITGFRYSADTSITNEIDHEGNNKLYYKNKQSYPVALHFALDDEYRVTLETENAKERLENVQESAWYYFEFDPSESIWTNFREDRHNIDFTISYNDGENNSYCVWFTDAQDVIYRDGWTYKYNEGGYWNHYEVSDSNRPDKPEYNPTNGKLRIYFYSETSKLGEIPSLIPSLKPKTPYMYGYDQIAEKNVRDGGWPMTKVVE